MKKKTALIFGVTGQDGSYLSEFLISKNYIVHGVKRRSSSINTNRVDHIYQDPHESKRNFILHYGDITDSTSVSKIIQLVKPDEIYNLAAQSHVAVSFEVPEYTANADGLGVLRILEAIRFHRMEKKIKFSLYEERLYLFTLVLLRAWHRQSFKSTVDQKILGKSRIQPKCSKLMLGLRLL